jgi:hypothetical protein
MAKLVTHKFVSSIPDGDDTGLVRPSNWNDTHDVSGVAESGTNTDITSMTGVTGGISSPNFVQFDTTVAESSAVGKLFWDDGDGVLSNGLKGGNVTLQIGTQEFARVFNDSGTTLTKGQAVYISGAQGNRVAVKLARADVEATSFGTIGLVAETMTNGAEGFIIVSGALYKLDTLGLVAGATVYLSPTTAGALTTTKPQAPDQLVVIGWVERVNATVGSIYVKIDNGYELDELHDVRITSPQSGNLLIYDATTSPVGVWKNANLTDGTGISITEGAGSVTIAIDSTVTTNSGTQTLTNKRVNPRAVAASATSGTLTPNGDTTDVFNAFGLTGAITVATPSGTPVDGQRLMLRFEDNGTGRGITWTTSSGAFRAVGITLPTTTVASKVTYVGCVYNSTDIFWDAIAVATQA